MDRVIARIVIDSEEWESAPPVAEELSTLTWRRVLSSTAFPFRATEVNYGIGLVGDQYYL